MVESTESFTLNSISLEKGVYKDLVKLSYSGNIPLSTIINDMIKEFMHTYILSKNMGHILLSKDIAKTAINSMTDEQIKEGAVYNANRYKEGVILENGRPSLASYLTLMKSFAKANKFALEITRNHTNANNGNYVLIAQFKLGPKFSLYKLETYKLLLEEFADVGKVDSTETMVYMEFKPRNDQTLKDPVRQ